MKKEKKARKRKHGTGHSASYTDEQWAAINGWADAAGETTARWWGKCVTTVDLSAPERTAAPPLVLDEEQQRCMSRVAGDLAEGARDDESSRFGALARDLLRERLEAMVRDGRRAEAIAGLHSVFGEARAEVIAAAFMPDGPKEPRMPGGRKREGPRMPPASGRSRAGCFDGKAGCRPRAHRDRRHAAPRYRQPDLDPPVSPIMKSAAEQHFQHFIDVPQSSFDPAEPRP